MNLQLQEISSLLRSSKVTDRKKACEGLSSALDEASTINILNNGEVLTWDELLNNVQVCMFQDAQKMDNDFRKKGTLNDKSLSGTKSLFLQILDASIKRNNGHINISNLVSYIEGSLRDAIMKKYCASFFPIIIKEYILSIPKSRQQLDSSNWQVLLVLVKTFIGEAASLDNSVVLKCLMLILKFGPESGLPVNILREQFDFINTLSQKMCITSSHFMQDVIDIVLEFCRHTAQDNRVSCCKLGETLFGLFLDSYNLTGRDVKTKNQLYNFFLLQVIIHHPKGSIKGEPNAYAVNWSNWLLCLKRLYKLLHSEISSYLKSNQRRNCSISTQGNDSNISDNFIKLFVETSRQIFLIDELQFSTTLSLDDTSQSTKKQKLDTSVYSCISEIQQSKSWIWVKLTSSILQAYSDMFDENSYTKLFETLLEVQVESKDINTLDSLYSCFVNMLYAQDALKINNPYEIRRLWNLVGESTLRTFGLNQNIEAAQTLLQILISKQIITEYKTVVNIYASNMLNYTRSRVKTLEIILEHIFIFLRSEDKDSLMNSILNIQHFKNPDYLLDHSTANILVGLVLQQWPGGNSEKMLKEPFEELRMIENIYLITNFQKNILENTENLMANHAQRNFTYDKKRADALVDKLTFFIEELMNETTDKIIYLIVLLANVLDRMLHYRLINATDAENISLIYLFENLLKSEHFLMEFNDFCKQDEGIIKTLMDKLNILNILFCENHHSMLLEYIKDTFPINLLKTLFEILAYHQQDSTTQFESRVNVRIAIINTLTNFCCLSGNTGMNEIQRNVLEVLVKPDYDYQSEIDYRQSMACLHRIIHLKPGCIEDATLENILSSLQQICTYRFSSSEDAKDILNILEKLYPHIAHSENKELKMTGINLLSGFYDFRDKYGSEIWILIIRCIRQLCLVDPDCQFSIWNGDEIVKKTPEFLCSNWQIVRIEAIKTLIIYFNVSSSVKQLQLIHRQEELFEKMFEMSRNLFNITGEFTEERRLDETMCRSASVIHTYVTLMFSCNNWTEECLLSLMKLEHEKKLGINHTVLSIFESKTTKETISSFVEKHLENVIIKWVQEGLQINNFHFELFNCGTKEEFYLKYFEICAPLLLFSDKNAIMKIAQAKNLSEKDILEKNVGRLLARNLKDSVDNLGPHFFKNNPAMAYLSNSFGEESFKIILLDNLDELFITLIHYITDEAHMNKYFSENVHFMVYQLSIDQFSAILKFLELVLLDGECVIKYVIRNKLYCIERILLGLKLKIYEATNDDILISFQRYTIFVNMLIKYLRKDSNWHEYFIRDTTYFLIHLMQNYTHNINVCICSCKYLNLFYHEILPCFSEVVGNFLSFIVNSLVHLLNTNQSLKETCMITLNFLIINNRDNLKIAIASLDAFPQNADFYEISTVYEHLKYENREVSLKDEITYFLGQKEVLPGHDSLIHLRRILVSKREQLQQLLLTLKNDLEFFEKSEKNLLQKFIISLVKTSLSSDKNVSYEALKCLGEIGPVNLHTLVLQPEKQIIPVDKTVHQLLSRHIISLLSHYVIDKDINVAKRASDAFYFVFSCKEARNATGIDAGYGEPVRKYNAPFLSYNSKIKLSEFLIKPSASTDDINNEIWCPRENLSHENWIISLTSSLLSLFTEKCYLPTLIPLCKAKRKFAEEILPLVIYLILNINRQGIIRNICEKLNLFFQSHWDVLINKSSNDNLIVVNIKSVKVMLNVVNFVRQQEIYSKRNPLNLNLDYLKIAKAAEFCGAHFTAILYIELWCRNRTEHMDLDPTASKNVIDIVSEKEDNILCSNMQQILRNAYKAIGDEAALPGCGISYLLKPESRVEYYKEIGQWNKVMSFYELQMACGRNSFMEELLDSCKKDGMYQLPLLCTTNLIQYECLWRLGQWDFIQNPCSKNSVHASNNFEEHRFYLLKSLQNKDVNSFKEFLLTTHDYIITLVKHTSLESCKSIYPILSHLQSLIEMESFSESCNNNTIMDVLKKWEYKDQIIQVNDFQYIEPIVTQRITMLSEYVKVTNDVSVRMLLGKMMLNFADYAKKEGHLKVATNIITKLHNLNINDEINDEITLREAQILWQSSDRTIAKHLVKTLVGKNTVNPRLQSAALALLGQYMTESSSDSRMVIMNNLFDSVKLMASIEQKNDQDFVNMLEVFDKIASFSDKEYQQIAAHMKSDLFQKKISGMQKFKELAKTMKQKNKKHLSIDERKAATINIKQTNIDQVEIDNIKKEKDDFLLFALKYYLKNITNSDINKIKIFRILSLFLENRDNPAITKLMEKYLPQIPSYKFIPILPQIIPHITDHSNDFFSTQINKIIEKCAEQHPHHTLPLLLSLKNSYKDKGYTGSSVNLTANDSRISAATNILNKQKRTNKLSGIISNLEFLSDAIIEIAYMKEAESNEAKKKPQTIPARMKIYKIKNYDNILCPTIVYPVSKSNSYKDIVGISHYASTYRVVGGINHPTQLTCYGTDGKPRLQLAKGQDDLRQDAVMQQVFMIINDLLASSKQTESLLIRTYKVVPMSMRSGLLEWVEGTTPIGEYLIDAHKQYRPKDETASRCKSMYQESADQPLKKKLEIFEKICSKFKPVMHYFFEKSFPQPTVWYEKRRSYINSIATTSMAGYILGIGDRHVSNILLDTQTAEVVHIDFGIAFEQGRCLPTPETVPFRLTRDIVDGMGISGVEGMFRNSCEKTMELLRLNSQTIMAILEVLLYDPLYVWAVSASEANKRQTDSSAYSVSSYVEEENTNITAERALLRLHGKLHGTEEGRPTNIAHQVGTLIQQAMDPTNLCRLFHGWQPYL